MDRHSDSEQHVLAAKISKGKVIVYQFLHVDNSYGLLCPKKIYECELSCLATASMIASIFSFYLAAMGRVWLDGGIYDNYMSYAGSRLENSNETRNVKEFSKLLDAFKEEIGIMMDLANVQHGLQWDF